jgi:hypothetical protein
MEAYLQGHLQSYLRYREVFLRVDVQLMSMRVTINERMFGGV